jgi:outer membrane protein TolC
MKRNLALLSLVVLCITAGPAVAQSPPRCVTLEDAINLALRQNVLLKAAGDKVEANQHKSLAARSDYFPQLRNESTYAGLVKRQSIDIPQGSLGILGGIILPPESERIFQGGNSFALSTTTLGQPITRLLKIRQARGIAEADTRIAASELKQAQNEVSVKVHEAYFGLLILQRLRRAAELALAAAEEASRDRREAVESGKALEVADLEARAGVLEARHALLTLDDQISDLAIDFNDLLGLPLETKVDLVVPPPLAPTTLSLDGHVELALRQNPEVHAAEQTVEKAQRGVKAAKTDYIPDISVFAQHIYQNGVPFLSRNNGAVGLKMDWEVFDFGKRRQTVAERESELAAAEENLQHVRNQVAVQVEKAYRKVDRSQKMIEVAEQGLAARREVVRLNGDQFDAGVIVKASYEDSGAKLAKSEADLLQAQLGYRLAKAELDRALGLAAH